MIKSDVKDFVSREVNGVEIIRYDNENCVNCNECCSIMACISDEEFQELNKFLTKNKFGKIIYKRAIDRICAKNKELGGLYFICPFSNGLKQCDIYNKRPAVCRDFHCMTVEKGISNIDKYGTRMILDLFKKDLMQMPVFVEGLKELIFEIEKQAF